MRIPRGGGIPDGGLEPGGGGGGTFGCILGGIEGIGTLPIIGGPLPIGPLPIMLPLPIGAFPLPPTGGRPIPRPSGGARIVPPLGRFPGKGPLPCKLEC